MYHEYCPRWDLADRLRNRFDVESYDVYEFHGDNNGEVDGNSDDQTSVSGAAGASTSLPDCAPEDEACHPHRAFQSFPYVGFGPSVPPGYPHGPFVEPDMGYEPAPPQPYGRPGAPQVYGRPEAPRGGFMDRLRRRFGYAGGGYGGNYGGGYGGGYGQPGAPAPPQVGGQSFQRWMQVHPGSNMMEYMGWWMQHGMNGAQINGESTFGCEGSLGDEDLLGGYDLRG